jgi:hypothetical protein
MSVPRSVRVVPLASREKDDLTDHLSPVERLLLVETLSREGWVLTGKPFPDYVRANAPVVVVPLTRAAHGGGKSR